MSEKPLASKSGPHFVERQAQGIARWLGGDIQSVSQSLSNDFDIVPVAADDDFGQSRKDILSFSDIFTGKEECSSAKFARATPAPSDINLTFWRRPWE
jgi:hypothetical protein